MNNENFKNFVSKMKKNNKKGIIYSYANWCQKCKKLNSIQSSIYELYQMNVDDEQELIEILDIRILPTYTMVKLNNKNGLEIVKQATTLEELVN